MVPTPLNSLMISGKSGVTSPAGLKGKTVGTDGDPASAQMLKAVLKKYNMSLSQIKLVTVNEGLVPAMESNKVSAIISGYRNVEAIRLASLGLKPKVYPVDTQGVPNYDELVIIANKSKLASDAAYRTMVREFLAGLGQGAAAHAHRWRRALSISSLDRVGLEHVPTSSSSIAVRASRAVTAAKLALRSHVMNP